MDVGIQACIGRRQRWVQTARPRAFDEAVQATPAMVSVTTQTDEKWTLKKVQFNDQVKLIKLRKKKIPWETQYTEWLDSTMTEQEKKDWVEKAESRRRHAAFWGIAEPSWRDSRYYKISMQDPTFDPTVPDEDRFANLSDDSTCDWAPLEARYRFSTKPTFSTSQYMRSAAREEATSTSWTVIDRIDRTLPWHCVVPQPGIYKPETLKMGHGQPSRRYRKAVVVDPRYCGY